MELFYIRCITDNNPQMIIHWVKPTGKCNIFFNELIKKQGYREFIFHYVLQSCWSLVRSKLVFRLHLLFQYSKHEFGYQDAEFQLVQKLSLRMNHPYDLR